MALPTPPLQDMPGHMALPTPPQQDTDEYYTDKLEMNSLLINNLKIQLYLTHVLNIDQQQKKKRGREARRWFVRSWIAQREQYGLYHKLLLHFQEHDLDFYRYYLRVDLAIFNEILQRITPRISRQDTNWRKAREPGLRLAITLRFMARP
ncbi:hypothetical protein Pcinc_016938 [Petrolisthes cinctipes]|uniref:Uncharacterized protein n=1 Tax=Petrolisthes cinctipes TaxID=88211 RepID=A0AAE1FPZ1_PETCI|nr:hypothetical protein Pcinc_016938 [Petrolisthes cinctipes]